MYTYRISLHKIFCGGKANGLCSNGIHNDIVRIETSYGDDTKTLSHAFVAAIVKINTLNSKPFKFIGFSLNQKLQAHKRDKKHHRNERKKYSKFQRKK